jgi:hypothetical protein
MTTNNQSLMNFHNNGIITFNKAIKKPYSERSALKHFKKKVKGYKFTKTFKFQCI